MHTPHSHCPFDCEHPQPFEYNGKSYCGRCEATCGKLNEMVPCTLQTCEGQMQLQISKRTLEPGWVEIRIVMQEPIVTPDYDATGDEARDSIATFVIATAGGILDVCGFYQVAQMLRDISIKMNL